MRSFLKLTKSGIVWFVLITAGVGYALAVVGGSMVESDLSTWIRLALTLIGLYLVSSGSFTLNQAQEWHLDAKMLRTQSRPIPAGIIQPWQGYLLGALMVLWGELVLAYVHPGAAVLALLTVALYNGLYTLHWKKHLSFGAVPGAIPGAMPALIGYVAAGGHFLSAESFYLFTIMFLWQMPHFWCLAIRHRDDYARAGLPVLPLKIGVDRTLYHMGLYVFAYVGLALAAPWFFTVHLAYLILILPVAAKVIVEFMRYFHGRAEKSWLPFFLWINASLLAFLVAPVIDRWIYVWLQGQGFGV